MKKLHFDNLGDNKILLLIMVLAGIFLVVGIFEIIPFENPKWNRIISSFGFLLQMLVYSRMFWFKYYVQYNTKGAVIKLNSFLGKTVRFEDIKATHFENEILTILKNDGTKLTFDLNAIVAEDAQKLNRIIVKHTTVNTW